MTVVLGTPDTEIYIINSFNPQSNLCKAGTMPWRRTMCVRDRDKDRDRGTKKYWIIGHLCLFVLTFILLLKKFVFKVGAFGTLSSYFQER